MLIKLLLISMFKTIGCEAKDLGLIKDDFNETKKKLLKILQNVIY